MELKRRVIHFMQIDGNFVERANDLPLTCRFARLAQRHVAGKGVTPERVPQSAVQHAVDGVALAGVRLPSPRNTPVACSLPDALAQVALVTETVQLDLTK